MLIRGGTSKGAYFLASDLPSSREERDALLLSIKGSPHPDQIDGIGGGHPLRSKVAIVAKSSDPRIDIDFLFAQVAVDKPFWKEPGQTEEKVKAIRKAEGEQAAAILGASFGA
jgi:4-oxalomesaconate tautomerase